MFELIAQAATATTQSSNPLTTGEAALLAVIVAGFSGVTELAKVAIAAWRKVKLDASGTATPSDARCPYVRCEAAGAHTDKLDRVIAMLSATDPSGRPLIYAHMTIVDKLDELITEIRRMSRTMHDAPSEN